MAAKPESPLSPLRRPLVLVVEDEPDIADLLRFHLEREGFRTLVAPGASRALEEVERRPPDVVLLDLMLPDLSGLEVCRVLRSRPATFRVPILILTAKSDETDRVLGLELGADDYVTKPFSPREVIARVRAVLRRSRVAEEEPEVYARGRLRVDFRNYEVWVDGRKVELTRKEFELLRFFVQWPNRVLSRLDILDCVWGEDTHVEPRTVDVHVRRLRKRIERDDARPELILTVRGVGYKFHEHALDG
ncbi:MAG: DNA-binding response regulator [Candidatus Binatia bacterium]|nr:MAG: DNA-binding response regulator [Candidatus Binatia bacterium]